MNAPKTASVYRKKYEEECTFVAKIVIQAAKEAFPVYKGLLEKAAFPEEVRCMFSPERYSITVTIRIAKTINTYLQNKALRFVNQLSPLEKSFSALSL